MFINTGSFKDFDALQKRKVSLEDLEKLVQKEIVKPDAKEVTPLPEPRDWRLTDSILIKCPGYWWLHSKVDRRWRTEGKSEEVGGTEMCPEAKRSFFQLREKFGRPPWDLVYRFEPRDLKKFKLANDPDQVQKRVR